MARIYQEILLFVFLLRSLKFPSAPTTFPTSPFSEPSFSVLPAQLPSGTRNFNVKSFVVASLLNSLYISHIFACIFAMSLTGFWLLTKMSCSPLFTALTLFPKTVLLEKLKSSNLSTPTLCEGFTYHEVAAGKACHIPVPLVKYVALSQSSQYIP